MITETTLTKDDVTNIILADNNYINSLTTEEQQIFLIIYKFFTKRKNYSKCINQLFLFYNFTYNEIGKKDYQKTHFSFLTGR